MLNLHGISQAAFDLIVNEEVSGQAVYSRKYRRPEWPGESSGVTIGIGYDVGQNSRTQFVADWKGKIPDAMVNALAKTCGVTGSAAKPLAQQLRATIDIPWEVALDVFSNHDVPRYLTMLKRAVPGVDRLSPDCLGVLLSITFNRGASFGTAGDRYAEMRDIKACVRSGALARIPSLIRSMKRLWPKSAGLRGRRDREAALFEKGLLHVAPARLMSDPVVDDPDVSTAGEDTPAPVAEDPAAIGNPDLFAVKKRLKAMNYTPGVLNDEWGGMTAGAIAGFINDRGGHIPAPASLEAFNEVKADIRNELQVAEDEVPTFVRPVSAARASADPTTVATVAPEVVPAKRSFLAMVWASIVAVGGAAWDTVSGWAQWLWDLFTDHKDDLPGDSSSYLGTAWEYVKDVPTPVWWMAAAGLFVFLALDARKGVKKITESVSTGARQ